MVLEAERKKNVKFDLWKKTLKLWPPLGYRVLRSYSKDIVPSKGLVEFYLRRIFLFFQKTLEIYDFRAHTKRRTDFVSLLFFPALFVLLIFESYFKNLHINGAGSKDIENELKICLVPVFMPFRKIFPSYRWRKFIYKIEF